MEVILAIPFGLLIGLVVGTVGGGGAILALPVLVYVLDEGAGPATTASLIVVALGASVATGSQARHGTVCWSVALLFSAPAAVGAYAGTLAGQTVSGRTLIIAFIPVMLAAAVLTYARGDQEIGEGDDECPEPNPGSTVGSGLGVGGLTGLFGVGGGFLIVPLLSGAMDFGMRRAIATSVAVITLTGLAALTAHLAEGAEPDWPLTLALSLSAAVGALAGTALGRRLPTRTLAHAFGIVVGLIALLLLIDVAFLGGPPIA